MLIPLVLVLPFAPGLAAPGCAVCAPAVPVACAISTGEALRKEEDGFGEVHLSSTFLMCVTLNAVVELDGVESVAAPPVEPVAFPGIGCPSASTSWPI